jgi:hypothetical protein
MEEKTGEELVALFEQSVKSRKNYFLDWEITELEYQEAKKELLEYIKKLEDKKTQTKSAILHYRFF